VVRLLPTAAEAYAEALVETLGFLSQARTTLPLGASGAGHVRLLKRRLVMILEGRTPGALPRACLWAVLVGGLLVLSLMPGWAQDRASPSADFHADEASSPATVEDGDTATDVSKTRGTVRRLESELRDLLADVRSVEDRLNRARARLARLEGRPEPPPTADRWGGDTTKGVPAPKAANRLTTKPGDSYRPPPVPRHREGGTGIWTPDS
jgi:hypothetical protein